jgi:hypothetical protein
MRHSRISLSLAVTAAILFASVASAGTIYEPFPYANGALSGNTDATAPSTLNGFSDTNKWTQTNANTQVIDGDLTYSGLPTTSTGHMAQLRNANDNPVHLGIGEYTLGSTIYFSMLLQVPSGATFPAFSSTGSFLSGFQFNPRTGAGNDMLGTSATSGGVVTIRTDQAGGGYNLGIAFRDAPAATTRIFNATKFLAGDIVYVVGKLATGSGSTDDVATLYLNPNPALAEPGIASAVSANAPGPTNDYNTGVDTPPTLRSFILRSNGVQPSNINVDEVRIGASWEEVTGQTFVPEPATIIMIVLGLSALLTQRRRAA